MAYHFNDNVYTKSFTPREYQVELLDAAIQRNIIVCLGSSQGKIFIATKLIQELANSVRKSFIDGGKRSVYLVDSLPLLKQQASYIRHLTDLTVGEFTCFEEISDYNNQDWINEFVNFQILVMTSEIFLHIIESGFLLLNNLNLIVLDECHKAIKDHPMRQIMKDYMKYEERPRVLGLTAPLLNGNCDPSRLEGELNRLEITLHSAAETASDIVSVLRYSARPKEFVIECAPHSPGKLDRLLEEQVEDIKNFLNDHRYDPSELYQDEFQEEIQSIPDPKLDPYRILDDFLSILHTLGPWCADRAALALLIQLEKLKVKTPYERHFLLLCMISTAMVKIRAICDEFFREYEEKDRFYIFSSPKVIRLLQIIKHFKPENDPEMIALEGRPPLRNAFSQTDPSLFDTDPILFTNVRIFKNTEILSSTIPLLDNISDRISNKSNDNLETIINSKCSELYLNNQDESNQRLSSNGPLVNDIGMKVTLEDSSESMEKIPNDHVITQLPQELNFPKINQSNDQNDLQDCQSISSIPNLISGTEDLSSDNLNSKIISKSFKNKFDNIEKAIRLELIKLILLNDYNNNRHITDNFLEEIEFILQTNNDEIINVSDNNDSSDCEDEEETEKKIYKELISVSTNTDPYDHTFDYPFYGRRKDSRRGGFGSCRYSRFDPSFRQNRSYLQEDADALCGIIFVQNKFTAKIIFHLLNEVKRSDPDLSFLAARYTIDKTADPLTDTREAEAEHRKQEDVLKRFRMRECNLLIGTSVLEEGIDIPKCNLVIRFDVPKAYRSYVQSKGRARAHDALYICMIESKQKQKFIKELAQYFEIEQMLLRKCANREPPDDEETEADQCTDLVETYRPEESTTESSVNLATAVALLNRYCAKLPSDTFTRLTPICTMDSCEIQGHNFYRCTLRLPINSPLKKSIIGAPMPTRVLARRIAALEACRALHEIRELDDNLLPVSKETFRLREEDESMWKLEPDEAEELEPKDPNEPRPGTTKRRQYYYKRIANALTDCRPISGKYTFLYQISMILTCPLPEEQNTRGRKLYPPEESSQGFGILTLKEIPKLCPFPIFTRSGEVSVKLELTNSLIVLTEEKIEKIVTFLNYTFTSVLRLQKYLMTFDPKASENSYFIVPTRKDGDHPAEVDWEFLEQIYENRDVKPQPISEETRQNFSFDPSKYLDAVIMPWYRNQDQPQYFYVAEICLHLNPKSTFPGSEYKTFDEYYFKKYNIQIQNSRQPLLDVDHTSARLNFLTPRYVNRKGVALPTSSEETKRAKRENLEQKQILVPELCTVHPFPASLWRKAVCLPCILYRINALLLADQIRCEVADTIALGIQHLEKDFEWPPLDFGWSLAEVLKKSKENNKISEEKKIDEPSNDKDLKEYKKKNKESETESDDEEESKKNGSKKEKEGDWMEIGTWSNDMAHRTLEMPDPEDYIPGMGLPANLSLLGEESELSQLGWSDDDLANRLQPSQISSLPNGNGVRYGSPSSWISTTITRYDPDPYSYDSDDSSSDLLSEASDDIQGLRIEFKSDNVAEAIEDERQTEERERRESARRGVAQGAAQAEAIAAAAGWEWDSDQELDRATEAYVEKFQQATLENEEKILGSGLFISSNQEIPLPPRKIRKKEDEIEKCSSPEFVNNKELINGEILEDFQENNNIEEAISINSPNKLSNTQILLTNGFCPININLSPLKQLAKNDINIKNGIIKGKTTELDDDLIEIPKCCSADPKLIELVQIGMKVHINNKFLNNISETILENHYLLSSDIDDYSDDFDPSITFSFDSQPELEGHPGPSPSVILQALTMSNANDGINLERLETIGDSFLKYAITTYLYCTYDTIHEGKLSHLRSKQVSNLNLYRLGRRKIFGESMIASKFEPHDNWLPPCYYVPKELEQALIEHGVPASHWNQAELPALKAMSREEICQLVRARGDQLRAESPDDFALESLPCFIPYNLITQHSIPDKSVADCVEALIGAYLISCGPRGALLFMAWLGICVLPREEVKVVEDERPVGTLISDSETNMQIRYGHLSSPKSPLLRNILCPEAELERLLDGYDAFERRIRYRFQDRSYLLQALTHASYAPNQLTDCYQRLEFLGDAVLDYLITRHLYEDLRQHSPGALTDLRSALVNNTIFASLAVRYGFHKYFRHLSPGLSDVVDRFVRIQEENGHTISEEYYLIEEEECEEAEDVEVPKALGDVFESVAGAIFLDSGMSLDAVWRVYYRMMKQEIEQFSTNVPKSPIRDLLELEPETAKFGKPEKLADGRRVRVTVEVFGKGSYKGIGRNYRIAKCTAAKCALKQLKKKGLLSKKS